ncbi:hypothetical protein LTS06_012521, partial [Exophiala xenobiotica]
MASIFRLSVALAIISSAVAVPVKPRSTTWSSLSSKIDRVVYLMLENHSFDNIAGYWDYRDDIDGLRNISYCNEFTNANWTIYDEPIMICAGPYEDEVPLVDPDHNFAGT